MSQPLTCFRCGSTLPPTGHICPHCGGSVALERAIKRHADAEGGAYFAGFVLAALFTAAVLWTLGWSWSWQSIVFTIVLGFFIGVQFVRRIPR
jgi:hypothetical protein